MSAIAISIARNVI